MNSWTYPRWVAHRGAGKQAPENTLAAFKLGYQYRYRMFECDVKLSSDDIAYLMHDDTLDRTTNGKGSPLQMRWSELEQLDAGSWHSSPYTHEPLAKLDVIADFVKSHDCDINLEIKPLPNTEAYTGTVIAGLAKNIWANSKHTPMISSFSEEALAAARDAAPTLPRALLFKDIPHDWLKRLRELQCVALDANWKTLNAELIKEAKAHGYRVMTYTVNDEAVAQRLQAQGVDLIITDEVHRFAPDTKA